MSTELNVALDKITSHDNSGHVNKATMYKAWTLSKSQLRPTFSRPITGWNSNFYDSKITFKRLKNKF